MLVSQLTLNSIGVVGEVMAADKRTKLIQAAVSLAYEKGFGNTSLADIAAEAKVPLGNVYYYFKSKDDICDAVVEQRLQEFEMLRQVWEQAESAKGRLCACVNTTLENKEILARGGCPVGTLSSELAKTGGASSHRADLPLAKLLAWIEVQFRVLGKMSSARGLAIHLLSALQGMAVLAHSLHDPDIVVTETRRLHEWIRSL
jgi:AcrR family transcriptional regulator